MALLFIVGTSTTSRAVQLRLMKHLRSEASPSGGKCYAASLGRSQSHSLTTTQALKIKRIRPFRRDMAMAPACIAACRRRYPSDLQLLAGCAEGRRMRLHIANAMGWASSNATQSNCDATQPPTIKYLYAYKEREPYSLFAKEKKKLNVHEFLLQCTPSTKIRDGDAAVCKCGIPSACEVCFAKLATQHHENK